MIYTVIVLDRISLDDTDWTILEALQEDGRISVAALARAVNLSPTATTERLNRLQNAGVILGFKAVVDPAALGLRLVAFIRMRPFRGTGKAFRKEIDAMPEVLECHHTTGEDCYLIKVAAADMSHLESITDRVAGFGDTTTSLAYSSPVPGRALVRTIRADS
jgi:Lrp/AsnC family leucine-responsive transcriptional regulator